MEGFRSKYSGAEVEERLDKVSDIPVLEEGLNNLSDDVEHIENELGAVNLPVVQPTISVTWTAYTAKDVQLDNVPYEEGTLSNPILEIGYKMSYSARYKWNDVDGCQSPEYVDVENSTWKSGIRPEKGEWSEKAEGTSITTSTTIKITLMSKEVGYKTNTSGFLVPATGYVKSSASVGVSFRNRMYYGTTTVVDVSEETIKKLATKKLASSKSLTLADVTTSNGQYFLYAYPERLSKIRANGWDVWSVSTPKQGAFIEKTVTVTNDAGYEQEYYTYITGNSGNLNKSTLEFI